MNGLNAIDLIRGLVVQFGQAPVTLGSFTFEAYEVPSQIAIGGTQRVTVHRIPGGGRIIDAMGPDDNVIRWHGFFTGSHAASRARAVDFMRKNGAAVQLAFGDYVFTVIVTKFSYVLRDRGAVLDYWIEVEALPDPSISIGSSATRMLEAVLLDVATAADMVATMASPAVATARAAILATDTTALAVGQPGGQTRLGGALSWAVQAASTTIGAESQAIGISSDARQAADLTRLCQSGANLASVLQAAGYVSRAKLWFGQIEGRPVTKPVLAS